jgi:hypothetical protein
MFIVEEDKKEKDAGVGSEGKKEGSERRGGEGDAVLTETDIDVKEEHDDMLTIECESLKVEPDSSEVRKQSVEETVVDLVMDVESELVGLFSETKKRTRSQDSTEEQELSELTIFILKTPNHVY